MKKIFTLLAAAFISVGSLFAENPYAPTGDEVVIGETQVLSNPNKLKQKKLAGSELGAPEGWSMEVLVDKNIEFIDKTFITIDGGQYVPMKLSNGAQHLITLPENHIANAVTIYSVVNKDAATDRPCYWAEIDGETYEKPETDNLTSFKDFSNPDVSYFTLKGNNSFTIKNSGEQLYVVLVVDYSVVIPETDCELAFPGSSYTAFYGEEFDSPKATVKEGALGTITYESSNPEVATVNATTGDVTFVGCGTTEITATYNPAAGETLESKSVSYTLTCNQFKTLVAYNVPGVENSGVELSGTCTTGTITAGGVSTPAYLFKNSWGADNSNYFKLTCDGGFKAGDKLTVKGVVSHDKNTAGFKLHYVEDYSQAAFTSVNFANVKSDKNTPATEVNYTITESADAIYLSRNGGTTTYVTYIEITRDLLAKELIVLAKPEITFNDNTLEVTIAQADGADVYYTTDGSTPTAESTLYEGPFTVEDNTTVKAIAIGDPKEYLNSEVAEALVVKAGITVENPVITSYNGTFYIACETPGATIKYSYDNETWEDFTACVTLFESKTVYAKAVREGATDSEVVSAEVVALPVPKVDNKYSKIIIIGYGSFVDGKTSNYMKGAAGVEKSAYGMDIKREENNFISNSTKIWSDYADGNGGTRTGINDGTKNTLVIPDNLEVNRIVFYSYVNAESGVAGWSEVNGEEIDITKVPMTCYKNGDYAKNPDKRAFNFDHATGEITFNGEGLIYTLDVWVSHKALSDPWQSGDKASYELGERVYILHEDADATILYTLDGADPDENNIYTEEAPAAAPARSSMDSATDEDHAGKTYNLAERPIVFNGERLNISYMAIKDGYKPSTVQTLGIGSDGQTTGIENVAVDSQNARVEFFNLQGVRVENPSAGIFIRRQGNNVSKVIVK